MHDEWCVHSYAYVSVCMRCVRLCLLAMTNEYCLYSTTSIWNCCHDASSILLCIVSHSSRFFVIFIQLCLSSCLHLLSFRFLILYFMSSLTFLFTLLSSHLPLHVSIFSFFHPFLCFSRLLHFDSFCLFSVHTSFGFRKKRRRKKWKKWPEPRNRELIQAKEITNASDFWALKSHESVFYYFRLLLNQHINHCLLMRILSAHTAPLPLSVSVSRPLWLLI